MAKFFQRSLLSLFAQMKAFVRPPPLAQDPPERLFGAAICFTWSRRTRLFAENIAAVIAGVRSKRQEGLFPNHCRDTVLLLHNDRRTIPYGSLKQVLWWNVSQ